MPTPPMRVGTGPLYSDACHGGRDAPWFSPSEGGHLKSFILIVSKKKYFEKRKEKKCNPINKISRSLGLQDKKTD